MDSSDYLGGSLQAQDSETPASSPFCLMIDLRPDSCHYK